MRRFSLITLMLCGFLPLPAFAQDAMGTPALGSNSKAPVEISADDAIEWLRNEHVYRVRGNAVAKQGDTTIKADLLEAAYDPALGEQNIQTITATGHVDIVNADRTITAEQGVYHVPTGELTLTGSNLRITSPTMTVTASQSLHYNRAENKASARGHAVIKTPERTLKADQIDAWFDTKSNALSKATARGHVTIQTAQEILQADNADYNTVTQQAVMIGNVSLTRGQNHLQGAKAVVNLKTGVSQLFGGDTNTTTSTTVPGSGGRVRAIFFPGSDKNPMPGQTTEGFIPMRPRDPKADKKS